MSRAIRVLVVDDEPTIRDLLQDALLDAGFLVDCAANGRLALAMLDVCRPDVILLDLMMPVMDGWAFARAFHAVELSPRPSIIVMSAAIDTEDAARVLGVAGWLEKPFDLEQLVTLLARHATAQ